MNDIEKAIEIIREDFKYSLGNTPLVNDVLNLAISALEKQIPKKPKKQPYMQEEFDSGTEYLCPNCELLVGGYSDDLEDWCGQHDYCEDCGQKIDWEEDNE